MNVFEQRLRNCQVALREAMAAGCRFGMRVFHECGTPMCVLGHYASRTDLQNAFRLSGDAQLHTTADQWALIDTHHVLEHFGLTKEESLELFSVYGCGEAKTPQEAIDYIERFIASKWPQPVQAPSTLDPAFLAFRDKFADAFSAA